MVDERAEGVRADIVAADEAQPIEALLVAEPHALVYVAHLAPRRTSTGVASPMWPRGTTRIARNVYPYPVDESRKAK
jgi:hypothetical protein